MLRSIEWDKSSGSSRVFFLPYNLFWIQKFLSFTSLENILEMYRMFVVNDPIPHSSSLPRWQDLISPDNRPARASVKIPHTLSPACTPAHTHIHVPAHSVAWAQWTTNTHENAHKKHEHFHDSYLHSTWDTLLSGQRVDASVLRRCSLSSLMHTRPVRLAPFLSSSHPPTSCFLFWPINRDFWGQGPGPDPTRPTGNSIPAQHVHALF